MKILDEGKGRLFTDPDPDHAREFFREKSRALTDKTTTVKEAVSKYIKSGTYLSIGGFGGVRIPVAVLHEIVRQKIKGLKLAGHTATHNCQVLAAGDSFDAVDISYVIGLEIRGISKNARKLFESGKVETTEWTNASMTWRYKAAALGIPFIVGREILGTSAFEYSGAKVIECPFTKKKWAAYPALYPDVAVIHVNEADIYGNCNIRGISVVDQDLSRAAKRLIITCERIVPTEKFRNNPDLVSIPYFCVDAVCEVPFGSYPGNMPFEYYSDEEHLKEWLSMEENPESFKVFIEKNIHSTKDFAEYLNLNGGAKKIEELKKKEFFQK